MQLCTQTVLVIESTDNLGDAESYLLRPPVDAILYWRDQPTPPEPESWQTKPTPPSWVLIYGTGHFLPQELGPTDADKALEFARSIINDKRYADKTARKYSEIPAMAVDKP